MDTDLVITIAAVGLLVLAVAYVIGRLHGEQAAEDAADSGASDDDQAGEPPDVAPTGGGGRIVPR